MVGKKKLWINKILILSLFKNHLSILKKIFVQFIFNVWYVFYFIKKNICNQLYSQAEPMFFFFLGQQETLKVAEKFLYSNKNTKKRYVFAKGQKTLRAWVSQEPTRSVFVKSNIGPFFATIDFHFFLTIYKETEMHERPNCSTKHS